MIAIKSVKESIPVGTEKLSLHCNENHEKPQDSRYFGPYSNQRPPKCFTG
jgi:type IV secretory pathway protease TraF